MIIRWELKFSPVENYTNRFRLRVNCEPDDLEEINSFLQNELNLDISPPFQSLVSEYKWGIYIYNLPSELKPKLIEKMFRICKQGVVIEQENNPVATTETNDLPKELGDVLSSLVKNMAEKIVEPTTVKDNKVTQQKENFSEDYYGVPLNQRYTFENFVVGTNNRFTHAAALAVAENPGKTYNPLFFYGGVGLGKTHLMQAIGHYVKKKRPLSKTLYITSEKFVSQVIDAIRKGGIQQLREAYSNVDLLMVDDIQFMAESESTQEEFFHIFNTLYQYGKQIVLTSDRPPKLLTTLADRLRSRFEWGLIADIKSPSLETRVAILKKKGEEENVNLDDNILLYIGSKLKSNIRELEGFLKRINAYASLTNQPVNMLLVKQLMSELLPEEELTDEEKKLIPVREEIPMSVSEKPKVTPVKTIPSIPKPKIQTFPSIRTSPTAQTPPVQQAQQQTATSPLTVKPRTQQKQKIVPEKKVEPVTVPPAVQEIVPQIKQEEDFYQDYETSVNIVEAAFFYPEGKTEEITTVKQKFAEVIKKHNLKYKIATVFDRPYNLENINYRMFVELCKTNNVTVCILLSPPPDSIVSLEEFNNNIVPLMENSDITFEYVPWRDLTKEYRYLNLALDIALSKFKIE